MDTSLVTYRMGYQIGYSVLTKLRDGLFGHTKNARDVLTLFHQAAYPRYCK